MNLLNRIKSLFNRAITPYAAFVNTKANRLQRLIDFRPFCVGDRVRVPDVGYGFGDREGVITESYGFHAYRVSLDGIENPEYCGVVHPGWTFFERELTRLP